MKDNALRSGPRPRRSCRGREPEAQSRAARARNASPGSAAPKTLEPATKRSVPASRASSIVSSETPPSTSSTTSAGSSPRRRAQPLGRLGDVALAAPAGVDAHQQAEVDDLRDRLDGLDRRARVDHDPGGAAGLADRLRARSGCAASPPGGSVITSAPAFANASTWRSGRSIIRWQSRIAAAAVHELADRLDDQRADRDRRDEMPVHHVDVDHLRARRPSPWSTCSPSREKSEARIEGAISRRGMRPLIRAPRRRVRLSGP